MKIALTLLCLLSACGLPPKAGDLCLEGGDLACQEHVLMICVCEKGCVWQKVNKGDRCHDDAS